MARISPSGQDTLPNPSKVFRQDTSVGVALVGFWGALSPRQAWTRLEINAQQRVKITAGQSQMSGLIQAHPSGEMQLTLYSGAGESTANLDGLWRLVGEELHLEFRSMDMVFRRMLKLTDTHA
jgi:hypothetical protein